MTSAMLFVLRLEAPLNANNTIQYNAIQFIFQTLLISQSMIWIQPVSFIFVHSFLLSAFLQRNTVDVGQIRLIGIATCLYLCMDPCGNLYTSVSILVKLIATNLLLNGDAVVPMKNEFKSLLNIVIDPLSIYK